MATFSQQGSKLVGTGNTGASNQGYSVSLYNNTLAVGGYLDNSGAGATWIFYRTPNTTTWSQQAGPLVGSGATGSANQGTSVACYLDTVAIGGPLDSTNAGAVWIFIRNSANTWSQQGSKLVGTGATGTAKQGTSVALWNNTLAVGGITDNTNVGAVWIWTRSGTTWTQQQKITASTNSLGSALSLYNYTLAIGASGDSTNVGAVFIYVYQNGSWVQQQKLIGSGNTGASQQGTSVSVWGDNVAFGGPANNSSAGATWIFNRSGTTWTQVGNLLAASSTANTFQGQSVSIFDTTLVVGAYGTSTNAGTAQVYNYNGNWVLSQQLVGTGPTGSAKQGYSVSLYQGYFASGGIADNTSVGATWVYTNGISAFTNYNNIITNTMNSVVPDLHGSRHSSGGADPLALTNAKIWLGNASNQIAEQTISGDATLSNAGVLALAYPTFTVTYLAVAGGGGGAGATSTSWGTGGGGAGGVVSSSQTFTMSATTSTFTITVGTGGAGGTDARGTSGNNSVISATGFTTVTAIGGGGGGYYDGVTPLSGLSGGSGGGGPGGAGTFGTGTGGQGNNGGAGFNGGSFSSGGGGGGGAGAVGSNADTFGNGANGGNGIANSITGSSVTYGGGGGGSFAGLNNPGTGGTGGGGNGGSAVQVTAGTNGLGGGGGAGTNTSGASGGSGIVIISVPLAYFYSYTGTATVTRGTTAIVSFTASGTLVLNTAAGTYNKYGYSVTTKGLISAVYNNLYMYNIFSTVTGRSIVASAYTAVGSAFLEQTVNSVGLTLSNATTTTSETDLYLIYTQIPFQVANSDSQLMVLYGSEYLVLNSLVSSTINNSTSNVGLYLIPASTLLTMYYFSTASGTSQATFGSYFGLSKIPQDIYSINYGSVATSIPSITVTGITNSTLTTSVSSNGISVSGGIITISITGFYLIHYQMGTNSAGGVKEMWVKWTKAAGGTERVVLNCVGATNSQINQISATGVHYLSASDTLQLFIQHNSVGTKNLNTTLNSKTVNTYFNVVRINPSIYVYYYGNVATTLVNGANGTTITESTLTNKYLSAGITTSNGTITVNVPGTYLMYLQSITNGGTTYSSNWVYPNGSLSSFRWCYCNVGTNIGIVEYTPASVTITYLAVGGGGGGGSDNGNLFLPGGGGGAGGFINSSQTLTLSGQYVLSTSVGTGGNAGSNSQGGNGGNSTITGTGFTSVTAIGGGGGGQGGTAPNGVSGGSGGGAGLINPGPSTGGSGTVGQGNNGGNCTFVAGGGTAGGGGAGAAGGSGNTSAGSGGNGLASSITGASVTYAGGGGGSGNTLSGGGAGGTGGGGTGATPSVPTAATPGTANTGGGGGGGSHGADVPAAGGSGVVIISVPTVNYVSQTGTATVTTNGANTVVKFTAGAGTITVAPSSSTTILNCYAGSSIVNVSAGTTLNMDVYQADGTTRTLNPATSLGGDTINTYFAVVKL